MSRSMDTGSGMTSKVSQIWARMAMLCDAEVLERHQGVLDLILGLPGVVLVVGVVVGVDRFSSR